MDVDSGREIAVEVTALGVRGDGIGRLADGRPVFVAGALPGERVRIRPGPRVAGGLRGTLVAVEGRASGRMEPACPHFGTCGGCAAQHMGPDRYAEWKVESLRAALAHAGIDAPIAPLVTIPAGSRRRARLFAQCRQGAVRIGFHEAESHRIIDMTACPVLDPALFRLVGAMRLVLADLLTDGKRAEVEAQLVDGVLDVVLRLARPLDVSLRQELARFAAEHGIGRLGFQALRPGKEEGSRGPVEPVIERMPVRAIFGGVTVALPPLAFLQASAPGEAALVAEVLAAVPDGARVADLFSGAGTFSFPLTPGRHVAAYDGDANLIAALGAAARGGGRGGRVTGTVRDLMRRPLTAQELRAFDAVVLDPPRAGAEAQAQTLAAGGPPVMVGVSCNPATFARDARGLVDGGYSITRLVPVDQFLWTRHLELVAVFRR